MSPLITAAQSGALAVVDGVHRADPSTISVLQRLAHDRELVLNDGTQLLSATRFNMVKELHGLDDAAMTAAKIWRIDPRFRLVALGEATVAGKPWLTEELASMFDVHTVAPLSIEEELELVSSCCSSYGGAKRLLDVAGATRAGGQNLLGGSITLSTRQLIQIAARLEKFPDESIADAVRRSLLAAFLPPLVRSTLNKVLVEAGAESTEPHGGAEIKLDVMLQNSNTAEGGKVLKIGEVQSRVLPASESNELLVPDVG